MPRQPESNGLQHKWTVFLTSLLSLCLIALTSCNKNEDTVAQQGLDGDLSAGDMHSPQVLTIPPPKSTSTAFRDLAKDPQEVIMTVNDEEVKFEEYKKEMENLMRMMQSQGVPSSQVEQMLANFKSQIMEGLVSRVLLEQECINQKIEITDTEIEAKMLVLEANLPKNMTLQSLLEQSGMTREMLMTNIREQLKIEKLLKIEDPTEAEVADYYEANKERMFDKPEMVQARHILISFEQTDDDAAKLDKKSTAEKLLKQLKEEGADFAELAKANSGCPSKMSGGDLGEFGRGQMVPEFEKAAFEMRAGEISDVVETQFGYHIIQTLDHISPKTNSLEEVKGRISEMLRGRAIQEKIEPYMDELRQRANVTYKEGFAPETDAPDEQ